MHQSLVWCEIEGIKVHAVSETGSIFRSYYFKRRYCLNPDHALLKVPAISWEVVHQVALEKFIEAITESTISRFWTTTCSTCECISARITVCPTSDPKRSDKIVISYGSCPLVGAEQKYYSPKLEFLALKLFFCDHLKECLYYVKSCDVYTDKILLCMSCQQEN